MVPAGSIARIASVPTALASPAIAETVTRAVTAQSFKVICPLHGIRTLAVWQKGLADLASSRGWVCRLDRWSYGRFSILAFFTPWTREAMLGWLRRQYDLEMHDRRLILTGGRPPSVVAHSFGTYILGYTLLRFDFIRFDKVILCGSILPPDFPWDQLIERGQVQAVRNEFGVRDPWVRWVRWFVRGTGPSGVVGFTGQHPRLEEDEFDFGHRDYFGLDHMEDRWVPFLDRPAPEIARVQGGPRIPRPKTVPPWGLYAVVAALVLAVIVSLALWKQWATGGRDVPTTAELRWLQIVVERPRINRERGVSYDLVRNGIDLDPPRIEPLRCAADDPAERDRFRLVGGFDRPTTWWLVHLDGKDVPQLLHESRSPGGGLVYPPDRWDKLRNKATPQSIPFDKEDSGGPHLLLLLQGPDHDASADLKAELLDELRDVKLPASELPRRGSIRTRGLSNSVDSLEPWEYGFLEGLRRKIPKGLTPLRVILISVTGASA